MGAAISPFNTLLLIQGIETLSLRMERHVANAQAVAGYLEAHDQVESVAYRRAGVEPWHEQARKCHSERCGVGAGVHHRGGRGPDVASDCNT